MWFDLLFLWGFYSLTQQISASFKMYWGPQRALVYVRQELLFLSIILEIKPKEFKNYLVFYFKVTIRNPLHINITYFMTKTVFCKAKTNSVRRMALFYILQISLMCGPTRGNLILQFDSSLELLPYVVLIKVYGQNPASHRYVAGKGRTGKIPKTLRDPLPTRWESLP